MRVYDEFMRNLSKQRSHSVHPALKGAVVVKAGNVVDYLFDTDQIAPRYILSLPCVLPPHEHMFVEFDVDGMGIGWYVHRFESRIGGLELQVRESVGARWFVGAYLYTPLYPIEPIINVALALDEKGVVIPVSNGDPYRIKPLTDIAQSLWGNDDYRASAVASVNVALWTIAFMHTKGALIEDIHPPAAQQKRHMKRYKAPMCSYKTIKVMGVGRSAQDAQGGQHAAPRLHIVRGYWADYRFGAGLFGKPALRGIYWVKEHQRGRPERGAIKADYEVYPHDE